MKPDLPEPTITDTAEALDATAEALAAWIATQEAKHGADND